jgi:hypothetical protein
LGGAFFLLPPSELSRTMFCHSATLSCLNFEVWDHL